MSIVHVLYRAILLVRTGPFGEACSPLRAVRVHLEESTNRVAGGPNPLATEERLVWNVSLLAKATGCPEI